MKLFEFNQKLPSQIGGFVSMSENGCGCMRGGTQVFYTKRYVSRKSQIFEFLTVL